MKWYKLLTAMMILVGPKQEIYCDFWFLSLSESYCRRIRRTIFLEVHISQTQLSIIKKYWKPHYKLFSMYNRAILSMQSHSSLAIIAMTSRSFFLTKTITGIFSLPYSTIQQLTKTEIEIGYIFFIYSHKIQNTISSTLTIFS